MKPAEGEGEEVDFKEVSQERAFELLKVGTNAGVPLLVLPNAPSASWHIDAADGCRVSACTSNPLAVALPRSSPPRCSAPPRA